MVTESVHLDEPLNSWRCLPILSLVSTALAQTLQSSSSSDCCAGQRSTPHSRTLEVRPGRITRKLGLRYDCDCERDETKSLLGVLMLGCDTMNG